VRPFYVLILAVLAGPALAQTWPSKPVHWIVPFPPGGANDVSARPVADRLSRALGQPIVVENRAGAAGIVGAEFVARSAPDGYTLLNASDSIIGAQHLHLNLGFDTLRDFTPVTQLVRQPIVLAAHPTLGVNSIAELLAFAKKNPGLGYATAGAGTEQHIFGEWFAHTAGIKLTHVPYKGGGQAIADFVGGQVPLAMLGSTPLMPHYKAGKIRLLGQSMSRRAGALPEVPTFEEAGLKGLVIEQWQGVFVPAGTPESIVLRLHAEIAKALLDPGVLDRYAGGALEPVGSTPEQFAKMLREDYDMLGRLVRELNIKAD
jgi:tripartite-type tricarboxylate transporter receptor subunit TctC